MEKQQKAVMGSGNAPSVTIEFESVSGLSLQKRFNGLKRYYGSMVGDNTAEWVARQMKDTLIRNIQLGTIVVKIDGKTAGLA